MMPDGGSADGVLVESDRNGSWAWAGVSLAPAPTLAENRGYVDVPEPQRRSEALAAEQAWLTALRPAADLAGFDVRHIGHPSSRRVSCVVLGRVHGPTPAKATAAALIWRDRLASTPRHVRADPIRDASTLYSCLSPFTPHQQGLFEVRKRLSWASCTRPDSPRRICFAISPFLPTGASWEPVWERLAHFPHPTMLSTLAEPYAISDNLRGHIGMLAQEYAWLAVPGPVNPVWSRSAPPDPFAMIAAPLYTDATRRYQGRAFRLRITVASAGPLPEDFAQLLAATVASDTGGADFEGGAAVVRQPAPAEFGAAWSNVVALNRNWLDDTYRQGAPPDTMNGVEQILCDLADPSEAATAFRLPYEVPGHLPLFRTPDRGPAAPAPASAATAEPAPGRHHRGFQDPGAPVFE